MPLTLSIRSADRAGPTLPPLTLDRRGAVIGRAPGGDWTLPDERATVSSRHCEIGWRDGAYLLADTSTNGTSVNGRRLTAPHRLQDGDVIGIGPYAIHAAVTPDAVRPQAGAGSPPVDVLLRAAGAERREVAAGDAEILSAAGTALRALAEGTALLLERSARARGEIGVASASHGAGALDGGVARLLAAPAPERAIGAAFAELEAHQLAALKAMQAAMKATLDTLSPAAIRKRGGGKSEGALWQEYERAFGDGESGFAETFAREFRLAYEGLTRR